MPADATRAWAALYNILANFTSIMYLLGGIRIYSFRAYPHLEADLAAHSSPAPLLVFGLVSCLSAFCAVKGVL